MKSVSIFQPNGATIAVSRSFDDGVVTYLPPHYRLDDPKIVAQRSCGIHCIDGANFQKSSSLRRGLGLPPRPLRRYASVQPNQPFVRSTVPRQDQNVCPVLERRNSGFRRTKHPRNAKGDRGGYFPRAGDRPFHARQQVGRASSLSTISGKTRDSSSLRPLQMKKNHNKTSRGRRGSDETRNNTSANKGFQPKKSTSISQRFDKNPSFKYEDDDIWIERIVLNGGPTGKEKRYFKSLRGNIVRNEPPTGASTIVYLEDIIFNEKQKKIPVTEPINKPPQMKPEKQTKEQGPSQEQAALSEAKQKNDLPTKSPKKEGKDALEEAETESVRQDPNTIPKGRSSFFDFMTKNRKNKPENENGKQK